MRLFFSIILLMSYGAAGLDAAWHALVVGVGKYPYCKKPDGRPAMDLDGPRHDAEAFSAFLANTMNVPATNIKMLLDEAGSKTAILQGLDDLAARVKPGDRVFIYYSGHGTSSLDPDTGGFGMDPATGGLVPSDLRPGPAPKVYEQLIVGKRDIRPRLQQLEQKAQVFVVFDACFSGESVKSILMPVQDAGRFVSLAALTSGEILSSELVRREKAGSPKAKSSDYPYSNVIYFSASRNNEVASDIPAWMLQELRGRFNTYDGRPHGAFSNVLLGMLTKQDPRQSTLCRDLFESVARATEQQGEVLGRRQSPQFLGPLTARDGLESVCLGMESSADPLPGLPPPPPPSSGGPEASAEIWAELERLASSASFDLQCNADKAQYHDGDATKLECNVSTPGYLSVLSYAEGDRDLTLLYPNELAGEVRLQPGPITIPASSNWEIENYLPKGRDQQRQLMVVLLTGKPLRMSADGQKAEIFRAIQSSFLPKLKSQRVRSSGYGASRIEFQIVK